MALRFAVTIMTMETTAGNAARKSASHGFAPEIDSLRKVDMVLASVAHVCLLCCRLLMRKLCYRMR